VTRATALLGASLLLLAPADAAVPPKESAGTLDRTLRGEWKGGACQGTWAFRADGTFELTHYSPGNDTLSATWGVRWSADPPTLRVTFSRSDRPELVGAKWELRIVRLDDEAVILEYAGGSRIRLERANKSSRDSQNNHPRRRPRIPSNLRHRSSKCPNGIRGVRVRAVESLSAEGGESVANPVHVDRRGTLLLGRGRPPLSDLSPGSGQAIRPRPSP